MKNRGVQNNRWWGFHRKWQEEVGEVIEEAPLTIYVNGIELATIMGTPLNQDWLAVGFLKNEGILNNVEEIEDLRITSEGCCVDVLLNRTVELPSKKIITSGCGGGITYDDPLIDIEPFQIESITTPDNILLAYKKLQTKDSLYARARGVHAAGLLDLEGNQLIKVAEDVGRHNTIDKLRGACLLEGIQTQGRAILTTGRISSEMLRKGALMGCPVIVSRTSPTSLAVEMARSWKITLVGYARHGKLRVYCYPERLGFKGNSE
ncbi:MAG: formate dehydrogenase accessory sulfurtransferase FdhD [Anaerolineales bacterium]|nr:formate dehydrogenase accessory sulfurtransferase FdhD [Anaerolineales bacterium]